MPQQLKLNKKTFYNCLGLLILFFALGLFFFGANTVGYSLGYFIGAALAILPTALPRLLIIGVVWVLIDRYLRNK